MFIESVLKECVRARDMNGDFNSAHEGYAVILEELDELWDEVRKKYNERDHIAMYNELIQIAAMAYRMSEDIIPLQCRKYKHDQKEG